MKKYVVPVEISQGARHVTLITKIKVLQKLNNNTGNLIFKIWVALFLERRVYEKADLWA